MTRPSPVSGAAASAPPPVDGANVESDFVVILAALLCALICAVGLIAVLRCSWLRRSPAVTGNGSPPCPAAANKGIKKKVLQSLPKFTYGTPVSFVSMSISSECSICLAEFAEGDEVRVLPQCGHGFHVACIDTWLVSCSSCPSCRRVLVVGACQKCGGFHMAHGGQGEIQPELKEGQVGQSGNRIATNNDNNFLP